MTGLDLFFARGFGFFGAAFLAASILVAVGHRGFAREFHAALLVDAEAFDPDFIAHLDDIFGLLDAEVGQFADVAQAVLAREEFDEAAKFLNGDNLATVDLSDLGFGGHAFDFAAGHFHAFGADRVDVDRAIV